MTDRELLQKAAKEAGYTLDNDGDRTDVRDSGGGPLKWNPLDDDGDALRLAAKLKIDLHFEYNGEALGDIVEAMTPELDDGSRGCMHETTAEDCAAATRRAIVRCAAAMADAPGAA